MSKLLRNAYVNVLVGVFAIVSAIAGQWLLGRGQTISAISLYAFGILLALWAFRQYRDIARPYVPNPGTLQRLNPRWLLLILLLPGAVAAWSIERLRIDPNRPSDLFWLLHIASILLFIGCVYFVKRRQKGSGSKESIQENPDSTSAPAWKISERLALFGILFIGLFLRLYQLPEYPFGTWYDEADIGLQSLRILREPEYRPLFIDSIHGPGHYVYLVSSLFLVLPKITFVIRLVSVIFGTLSIPAGFMVGNQLFGRGPGLIIAFFLAVSRWSINFSRIGMFNMPVTVFTLLGIGFLLCALRRNRLTDYLWAGFFLGFGLNFYGVFLVFLAVVFVFLLHNVMSHGRILLYQWKGLLVAAMAGLLFLVPLAIYVMEYPDIYFNRSRTVSIFNEYSGDEVWDVVRENAVVHLLMYNLRGDPNGRHNLPGTPMLSSVAGALLVLGLGLSLSRFWRARSLLLVVWFLGMMTSGILTLSFEAPQSLRAIGTLPVVYLLGTVPLALLWQNWRATAVGKQWPWLFVCPLLVLLAAVAFPNYRTYFGQQKNDFAVWNAFSTAESISGKLIAEHKDETDIYVTTLYHGHLTVRFLSDIEPTYQRIDTTAHLPLQASPQRDILILLDDQRRSFFEEARRYYPNAEFVEHKPPFGGPTVLYQIRLSPADLASIQGLNVSYFAGEEWSGPSVATEKHQTLSVEWPRDAPVAAPFSAEWSGVLSVGRYGPHKLVLRAPSRAELYVDEELVASAAAMETEPTDGEGEAIVAALELAQGNHNLRIRAVSGEGPVTFSWQRPGEDEQIVPSSALNVPPVTNNGLLGRYYANGDWREPAAFTRIDPQINLYFHVIPLPRPYTVEWVGKIAIPQEGVYTLGIESIDESELLIDDEQVAASPEPNQYNENPVTLTAGLHDIRIRFADRTNYTHVNLYWAPPGQGIQPVPSEVLFPPQGSYAHVNIEDLSIFDTVPETASVLNAAALLAGEPQVVRFEVINEDFERPRGVAAANGRLYIADPDAQELIVFEADQRVARVQRSDQRFREPVDVDADAAGNIYVLDTGHGQVSMHDAAGDFVQVLPIPERVGHARGFHVDSQGHIWLAVTSAQLVAAYDTNGQELVRFSTALNGADLQPVDVAFHAADAVYVTVIGTRTSVLRFSEDGELLDSWPLIPANSKDGPHLSLDRSGVLYVTQPEQGGVLRIAGGEDEDVSAWIFPPSTPIRKIVGIALEESGSLVVTDSENGSIYRLPIEP